MVKILHLLPNLGLGGTEKIILEICRRADRKRFHMSVAALKSDGPTGEALRRINVPVSALHSPDRFLPGALDLPFLLFRLRNVIRSTAPDILHTWLTRANVAGRMVSLMAPGPVLISSLRVMETEKNYHLLAESLTHSLSRAVTVNCTALQQFAGEKMHIPKDKLVLIHNGIDLSAVPPAVDSGAARPLRIGTLGRLHAQKGMDIFLRAAALVLKESPDCRFVIGGDGPERSKLRDLAGSLGILSSVDFAGLVRNPVEFITMLDIFVLASRWEGMPNVVLEAMSLRKPIAATSVGGITDLITHREQGLLVPPERADALAESILVLVRNPPLRMELSGRAYERVSRDFTMDKMVSKYESFYESLAS